MYHGKRYYILNVDFETNGFNGAVLDKEGKLVLGQQYHALMEGAFQLIDPETLDVIDSTEALIYDTERAENWNESTREFHMKSHDGITESFLSRWSDSVRVSPETLEETIINMLERHLGKLEKADPRSEIQIVLCARSVGFDRSFIDAQMPKLGRLISHQMFDISSFRVAIRMFHPTMKDIKRGYTNHNAMDDCEHIRDEIRLIKEYLDLSVTPSRYLEDYIKEQSQPITWSNLWHMFTAKVLSYFA